MVSIKPAIKMGQAASIDESLCVSLKGTSYYDKEYTVVRTSGAADPGWMMCHHENIYRPDYEEDCCGATKHAASEDEKAETWRVFMREGKDKGPLHGWRRVGTFYPTALQGDEAAIKAWQDDLVRFLNELDAARPARIAEARAKEDADAVADKQARRVWLKSLEDNADKQIAAASAADRALLRAKEVLETIAADPASDKATIVMTADWAEKLTAADKKAAQAATYAAMMVDKARAEVEAREDAAAVAAVAAASAAGRAPPIPALR